MGRPGARRPACPPRPAGRHGVLGARLLQPLDDPAGHGAHVGAAMAADVRFVTGAAQRDPDVLPVQCPGDGLGDGGLAHARWPHEQEDRAPAHGPRFRLLRVVGLSGSCSSVTAPVVPAPALRALRCPPVSAAAHLPLRWPLVPRQLSPRRLPRPPSSAARLRRRLQRGRFRTLHLELADGQELDDAILHVLEAVVVLLEDLLRTGTGRSCPRSGCSTAAR
jgi:hypothetical protein